jgi:hypothetical protein
LIPVPATAGSDPLKDRGRDGHSFEEEGISTPAEADKGVRCIEINRDAGMFVQLYFNGELILEYSAVFPYESEYHYQMYYR